MRTKNTLTQTPRLEQREAQQHCIPHARPNRLHDVRVDGDALHQHRVDADANHDQKRLKPQREQRLEIVLPNAAPIVIRHRGQWDGAKRHREVDFHHAPVDDDEDADGQDAHREAHDHALEIQPDELAELHRFQLCREAADHRGDVDVGSRGDYARGAVHNALRHVEDAHDDVERVGDDHDGDERLEDPAKEHPGVHVVQIVFIDDHVDQLVAHDEREHHARDGDDDRFGERADHGEDAAIPSGRRRSHLRGNLSDF